MKILHQERRKIIIIVVLRDMIQKYFRILHLVSKYIFPLHKLRYFDSFRQNSFAWQPMLRQKLSNYSSQRNQTLTGREREREKRKLFILFNLDKLFVPCITVYGECQITAHIGFQNLPEDVQLCSIIRATFMIMIDYRINFLQGLRLENVLQTASSFCNTNHCITGVIEL